MLDEEAKFSLDIDRINQISIVPAMLEVICQTTGMGFAAIARVTQDRWIACSVRDEIQFGLKPGGELKIETTICNEIRSSNELVVIDNVKDNELYCNHHTPKLYGFQSYISVPIILKTGEFFGTLCAIDPKPALLNNNSIIGMFNLFVELISFHLQSLELMHKSNLAVKELNRQLLETMDENRQYQYISNHNLQEPLRKIRLFSSMLITAAEADETGKVKDLALKVNTNAQGFSMMIKDLSDLSELNNKNSTFEAVDLNKVVADVCAQLSEPIKAKNAVFDINFLPTIQALPIQMEQLFFHLINNAIKFARKQTIPVIKIYAKNPSFVTLQSQFASQIDKIEICVEDNGIGIEKSQLEKIFDIFSKLPYNQVPEGGGIGLAYCRKIVRNHGGSITAHSGPESGTTFSITLPFSKKNN